MESTLRTKEIPSKMFSPRSFQSVRTDREFMIDLIVRQNKLNCFSDWSWKIDFIFYLNSLEHFYSADGISWVLKNKIKLYHTVIGKQVFEAERHTKNGVIELFKMLIMCIDKSENNVHEVLENSWAPWSPFLEAWTYRLQANNSYKIMGDWHILLGTRET